MTTETLIHIYSPLSPFIDTSFLFSHYCLFVFVVLVLDSNVFDLLFVVGLS